MPHPEKCCKDRKPSLSPIMTGILGGRSLTVSSHVPGMQTWGTALQASGPAEQHPETQAQAHVTLSESGSPGSSTLGR